MRIQTEDLRFGVPVVSIVISVNEGFRHVVDFGFDIQVFWSSTRHFLKQLFTIIRGYYFAHKHAVFSCFLDVMLPLCYIAFIPRLQL